MGKSTGMGSSPKEGARVVVGFVVGDCVSSGILRTVGAGVERMGAEVAARGDAVGD